MQRGKGTDTINFIPEKSKADALSPRYKSTYGESCERSGKAKGACFEDWNSMFSITAAIQNKLH